MKSDKYKSYRALRHEAKKKQKDEYVDEIHHPDEKIRQVRKCLKGKNLEILELFAGEDGNLTKIYKEYGNVYPYDKKLNTGDSFLVYHDLIFNKKTYDVVDLDPYGFPNRFFPDIYLLIDDGYLFVTMPKPYVNILNKMT